MKLDHIHYILEIERQGSLNRAANALFISQPYLSNMLREFEYELGIQLFIRTPKGMTPTPAGREVLEYAKKIMEYVEKIQSLKPSEKQEMELLSVASISSSVILDLCHEYQDILNYAGVRLSFTELPDNEIIQAVSTGMVDVGFFYYQDYREREIMYELENKGLVFNELVREPFCVLVNPENSLSNRESVTIEEMNQYSFICEADESNVLVHKRFFPSWFDNERIAAVKFGNNRGAMCYLADHPNCFFMGQYSLNYTNPLVVANRFKYIPLSNTPYLLVTGYALRRNMKLSAAKREFLSYISEHFRMQS